LVLAGVDIGQTLANVQYSRAQYEHAIDSFILAKKIDEIHKAIGGVSGFEIGLESKIAKRMISSLGKSLVALGFSYAAEGKGAFMFGFGNTLYSNEVSKVRAAAMKMYAQANQEAKWTHLLEKLSFTLTSSDQLVPYLPDVRVRGSLYGGTLSTNIKPIGGWWEDWQVDIGIVVRSYKYTASGKTVVILDPIMEKGSDRYRDTGVSKLEMSVNPYSGTTILSTDGNIDGIFGDSLAFQYDSMPSTILVTLTLTHDNGNIVSGDATIDLSALMARPDGDYCLVYVGCPVNTLVKSSSGDSIGISSEGEFHNTFANAYRTAFGTSSMYYLPAGSVYQILVTGVDDGSYVLGTYDIGVDSMMGFEVWNLTTRAGAVDTFEFDAASASFRAKCALNQTCDLTVTRQTTSNSSSMTLSSVQLVVGYSYEIEVTNSESLGSTNDTSAVMRIDTDGDGVYESIADLRNGMTGTDVTEATRTISTSSFAPYVVVTAVALAIVVVLVLVVAFDRRSKRKES
jgi:hypothetical protein